MTPEIDNLLSPIVKDSYGIDEQARISQLSGGLVNEALLVQTDERSFVLRKLAPALGANIIQNTDAVARHLQIAGWEAPLIKPTQSGDLYIADESDRLWHAVTYIESDTDTNIEYGPDLASSVGNMLGNWHSDVKSLDYIPQSLPYFHDTEYIAKKLLGEIPLLPNKTMQTLGHMLLEDYYRQPVDLDTDHQIIHGDPKLDNMLFHGSEPFTLIDFDCVMRESVWTDNGDFLRSLSRKLIDADVDPTDSYIAFAQSYADSTREKLSFDHAVDNSLQSTRRIAAELGMRYLSDIVDGQRYFTWDAKLYPSRAEALHNKAWAQFEIVQTVRHHINEGEPLACAE